MDGIFVAPSSSQLEVSLKRDGRTIRLRLRHCPVFLQESKGSSTEIFGFLASQRIKPLNRKIRKFCYCVPTSPPRFVRGN